MNDFESSRLVLSVGACGLWISAEAHSRHQAAQFKLSLAIIPLRGLLFAIREQADTLADLLLVAYSLFKCARQTHPGSMKLGTGLGEYSTVILFSGPSWGFDFCVGSIPQMKPLSCLSGISRSHLSARSSCMHAISVDTKPAVFCCFRPSAGKARRVHMAVNCLPASFLFATRMVVDRPRPQRVSRH